MTPIDAVNYQGRRTADRKAVKLDMFCQPVAVRVDTPLRARHDRTAYLLNLPEFKGVFTAELIALARTRVRTVAADRASAIAVLQGARG